MISFTKLVFSFSSSLRDYYKCFRFFLLYTSSLEYIWFVRLFGSKGSYLAFNRSREKTTHHFSFSSAALVSCGIRIYLHFIFWISSAVCCRSSNSTFCCQFTGVILSSFPQCPPSNLKTEGDRSPLFLPPGSGLICHPT